MVLRHLSFKTLLVVSLFIVALIPSLALVQTWWQLQQLAEMVNREQKESRALSDLAHVYAEQSDQFERSSRQWAALQEPVFAHNSLVAAQSLQGVAAQLQGIEDGRLQQLAGRLLIWSKQSQALLQTDKPVLAELQRQYAALSGLGGELDSQVRRLAALRKQQWEDSVRQNRQQADKVAILSLCIAVLAGLLLAWLLVRPLQRLRDKIGRLALGERGQHWNISAPADILQLTTALSELDGRLAQLEQDKANFFRHVSHELKTPLAAIQEATSLLHDQIPGPLLPAQQEIIGITLSNTRLLRQRVDALLQHDAANWLGRPLAMEEHDLLELVRHAADTMQPLFQQKKLQLRLPASSLRVFVDPAKFRTIIDNLLSNAIRFSPYQGSISVAFGDDAECSWIEVADEGPGIGPQERELVFQPFYTGMPPAGEPAGTGIGLTMVKTFAQLMGGDVECLPVKHGACLRVWWPLLPSGKTEI